MVSRRGCRMQVAAAALALASLAGCQITGDPRTAHAAAVPTEATPPLTAVQRADLKFALGRSLENGGDLDRAIALYSDTVATDPKRVDAQLRLAALYERQDRLTESSDCYRKALAMAPANPDVYCNIGYSFYLHEDWPHAAEFLQYAVQLQPNHARAHNNLGLVLARLGRTDEALAEFKKAGCSNAEARSNLAYCFMVDGKVAQARHDYETALRLDPACAPAKSALHDLNVMAAHVPTPQPETTAITPVSNLSIDGKSSPSAVTWRAQEQQANKTSESQ